MSLHHNDWLKLLGVTAAALATGGAAGVGPLAGLLGGAGAGGAGVGAGAAGAAATGAGAAGAAGASGASTGATLSGLIGKSLAQGGAQAVTGGLLSAAMPQQGMTTPGNVPTLQTPDMSMQLQQLMQKRVGMR